MQLIAKVTIYGANNSVTKPGGTFECDETEGKGLIAQGFAKEAEQEAPAKPLSKAEKAAADKAAKEADEAAAKAKAEADAAAGDANKGGNE